MKKLISYALNDYPGAQNDLRGCINDQENIAANLSTDFGFDVIKFKNSQVTKELFRDTLTALIISAVAGDILVIHVSSHGTQLQDRNQDEADGYDEALYLYDGAFSDDEFTSILSRLKEGVVCIFIMDCCFSGTITRDINKKARFKPLFLEVDSEGLPVENKRRKSKEINPLMNHIVLTGCSDTETSDDAFISGSYNGALTYYAMKTLDPGLSYKSWHEVLAKKLKSAGHSQTPQLEGPDNLLNLGVFGSTLAKKKRKCFLLKLFGK